MNNSTTVKAVKSMKDDAFVTLAGRITSRIGGDKYVFQDSSGQIIVDIDDEDFRGQSVSAETTVRINCEVDREFGRATEIDVKTLEVVSKTTIQYGGPVRNTRVLGTVETGPFFSSFG